MHSLVPLSYFMKPKKFNSITIPCDTSDELLEGEDCHNSTDDEDDDPYYDSRDKDNNDDNSSEEYDGDKIKVEIVTHTTDTEIFWLQILR